MADSVVPHSVAYLKSRARILHRQARFGEADVLARIRTIPELAALDEPALAAAVRRRHALTAVARQTGFSNWGHALNVLRGTETGDFGTILYPSRCSAHSNIWCADYAQARTIHAENGGYLLAYRRHCFIVDEYFIDTLGLDPGDENWSRINRDWVRPADVHARDRLYSRLVHAAIKTSDATGKA